MHDPKDSIKEGYEVTDMNIRLILIFLIGLAAMTIGGMLTIFLVLRGLEDSRAPLNQTAASPLRATGGQISEGPLLQQDPVAEKEEVFKAAEDHLSSYGVISDTPELRRVHIPISRAIELVSSGGVPYRQEAVTAVISDAAEIGKRP